jgi:hypothetical protein
MLRPFCSALAVIPALAAFAAPARAQEADFDDVSPAVPAIADAVRGGALLPSTLAPRVGAVGAIAFGFAGYDGARSSPVGSATAEARIWGPFALRGGAEYSDVRKQLRPTIGGRVQLLRQERHGIDGSLGVFYRPEGFTEPEGEIESFISLGHRFDRFAILGNLVYGQDPEGNERDGELRFAALVAAGRWTFGLDSRARFALGTQRSATAQAEPKFDLLAGPTAGAVVGPLAFFAEAGPSVVRLTGNTSTGLAALAGVGSVF